MEKYTIYTDGGCAVNPGGPGGAACIVISDETGEVGMHSRGYFRTTNNRMEMFAVLMALEHVPENASALIRTDSQYAINCANGSWRKTKNRDLWQELDREIRKRSIKFEWIRGHSGNGQNEQCDAMCTKAMQNPQYHDAGYEQQKQEGAEFWQNVETYERKTDVGGAMAVRISIPQEYHDPEIVFVGTGAYAKEKDITRSCASSVYAFRMSQKKFRDYAALKTGGMDVWSRRKKDKILEGNPQRDIIENVFASCGLNEKQQNVAARWLARGLTLRDAIRKALVDEEISSNRIRR